MAIVVVKLEASGARARYPFQVSAPSLPPHHARPASRPPVALVLRMRVSRWCVLCMVQAESVLLNGDVEEPVMACYTLAPPHDGTAGLLQVRTSALTR